MASTRRRSHTSLKEDLFERIQSYELFQAIRVLETLAAAEKHDAGFSLVEPVGRSVEPSKASLRIRSALPLSFAATEVTAIHRSPNDNSIEITQTLIGLTGPSGVLPHAFSELVQISVRERNPVFREFFDIFNNKLASLLFEAWAKYRIIIERERAITVGIPRTIDHALKSLVGLGFPAMTERTQIPDSTFVFFGGLLGRQGRSAMSVERSLSGALGHTIRIEQFLGEWFVITPAERTQLPVSSKSNGAFTRLGHDTVIGAHVFDAQSSVLIRVGPLGYADFRSLLSDGPRAQLLIDLAAHALGADKTFRICLELKKEEIPSLQLEKEENSPTASRLGWNTWFAMTSPRQSSAFAEFRPLSHLR